MKPLWIQQQREALNLSATDQQQLLTQQKEQLSTLYKQHQMDIHIYGTQYPLPLMNVDDVLTSLPPHEKELDEIFCREIGKLVPLLTSSTINGVELYIARLSSVMSALAKTPARKQILDRIAAPYLSSLLLKENGLVSSYLSLVNESIPDDQKTLLGSLRYIVTLMSNDGHRGNLGSHIKPPYQADKPIGTYATQFEQFVQRIDGIRMDSLEMLTNHALNGERRRQFVRGLSGNLRILVETPSIDTSWHAFKQAYFNGYIRLHPNTSLFGKPHHQQDRNTRKTPPNGNRQHKQPSAPSTSARNHTAAPPKRHFNKPNRPFDKKPQFQSPSFLHTHPASTVKDNSKVRRQRSKKNQVNAITTEMKSQRSMLQALMDKLNFFDVPHTAVTVVCLLTLCMAVNGWECASIPPHYPLLYRQGTYSFAGSRAVEASEMHTVCTPELFHPALLVDSILISQDNFFALETKVAPYEDSDPPISCRPLVAMSNLSTSDIFLTKHLETTFSESTFLNFLDIYAYHHAFNFSCPSNNEMETQIPDGKVVPPSPIRKRKRPLDIDVLSSPEYAKLRQSHSISSDKIRDLENEVSRLQFQLSAAGKDLADFKSQSETREKKIKVHLDRLPHAETDLAQARDQLASSKDALAAQMKLHKDTLTELETLRENYNRHVSLADGAKNALLEFQTRTLQQAGTEKKLHETELHSMRNKHAQAIDDLKQQATTKCNQLIEASEKKMQQQCDLQRKRDSTEFAKEKTRLSEAATTKLKSELDKMKLIYDKEIAAVKETIKTSAGDKMEMDDDDNLIKRIADQARKISSLQQLLAIKTEQETPSSTHNPELCTSYNNFVIFMDHLKRMELTDAMLTLPRSIVSLLTFLSTLLGTKIWSNRSHNKLPQHNARATAPSPKTDYSAPLLSPAKWKFGDGPVPASVNAVLSEALPRLRIIMGNLPITLLLDTGASINVCSLSIAKQIDKEYILARHPTSATAYSANGTELSLHEIIHLRIPIGQDHYNIICHVSPHVSHDLILGQPGLKAFGDFSISWKHGRIHLGSHSFPISNAYPFKLTSNTDLPPHSTNILNPRIDAPVNVLLDAVYTVASPYFKGSNQLVTYNAISPVIDNQINFVINNIGANPVALYDKTTLGYVTLVESLSETDLRITNDGYSSDEADICDRLPPYPTSLPNQQLQKSDFLSQVQLPPDALSKDQLSRLHDILWTHRSVFHEFNPTPGRYNGPETLELRTAPHDIPKPIRAPRYSVEKENEIKRQVDDMLKHDMIEPSRTPYLSRINLVKKKNNEWRFVVDFRSINKLIVPQSHHIPRIDTILDKASGKQYYTSLDLKNGFHQLTLDKDSRYLTGFPTHIGIFQYKRIPMGLVGSPDFFNHIVEKLFKSSNNFVYLDDILLTDNSIDEHLENINTALSKALSFDFRFSLTKCLFFQQSLEYLGFIISKDGIQPNPKKTAALRNKPIPSNEKELRSFLGAANYYRKHIPGYSKLANILYDCTSQFLWTSKHTEAFENIKAALADACTLSPPDDSAPYTIVTDASTQGIGAALMQNNRPIAFTSRTLKNAELMYAPVQLEALGLVFALKSFSPYIYGKRTTVLTDQSSLLSLMTKTDVSNILDRYKNYIMGFDIDIRYIKGSDNAVADYLSRSVFSVEVTPIDEKYHSVFPKTTNYFQTPYIVSQFPQFLNDNEQLDYPDCKIQSRGKTGIYVPQILRFMLLSLWHEHPLLGNHSGYEKGVRKFKDIFLWPSMDNDIKKIWSTCSKCLKSKTQSPLMAPVSTKTIPIPPHPWHTLSLDHIVIDENNNALVAIDEFSKFVTLIHTTNLGAITAINSLERIFFLIGFPDVIKTDNGPAFISNPFQLFCNTYGIKHYTVSAYNHQGNGIVERFNRIIREAIRLYPKTDIKLLLHSTQYAHNFGYTTTQEGKPKEYILTTTDKWLQEPYINTSLSGRYDLLLYLKSLITSSTKQNPAETPQRIPPGTLVFRRNPTAHKNSEQYEGPYEVIEHIHGDSYIIQKLSFKGRRIESAFKTNARLLKLAPKHFSLSTPNDTPLEETTPPSLQAEVSTENIKSTKKRGRPKKAYNKESIPPQKEPKTDIKKKRGRPRKLTRKTTNKNKSPSVNETVKEMKKRGRPRKIITEELSNE
ncbi:Reverse transcriptase domain and Integrase,catalytic core domain and Ribonuclease H-like domain and Aspartic peptidase domain-containing protein [Strongyloides ratti]|uniref:RNA-directed DNA polymerase n=1 Tax=Strongyloides ratti TaxID=34506 RepID=A0A090MR62_STRRB|nr:Reverse transcriptase domain and Integrase,catalytic core domain and Ribonuclease H-like domain and Aspartic peptidase domain-containing protein [Strongyloides ratti]CEF60668.1 Reverse transcriptase domain and Integrase,catalytic core domain and Ribonuclease H-like domain and Aspartic peptidase domain-containing protein [Strongyloides ratti]